MDPLLNSADVPVKNQNPGQVIEISHLRKGFDIQEVLKDVSLKLSNGENLAVLGKSGSGKSVLIKCIVRLFSPDFGTIKVLGKDVNTLNSEFSSPHGREDFRRHRQNEIGKRGGTSQHCHLAAATGFARVAEKNWIPFSERSAV